MNLNSAKAIAKTDLPLFDFSMLRLDRDIRIEKIRGSLLESAWFKLVMLPRSPTIFRRLDLFISPRDFSFLRKARVLEGASVW